MGEWSSVDRDSLGIVDIVSEGLAVENSTAVIANFFDVVPYITSSEVEPTIAGSVEMWALSLSKQDRELLQTDPLGSHTAAFTHWAGLMLDVWLAFGGKDFTNRQVGFALAVRAGNEDLDFGHRCLLKTKNPTWLRVD
jgi:hypothetical protein